MASKSGKEKKAGRTPSTNPKNDSEKSTSKSKKSSEEDDDSEFEEEETKTSSLKTSDSKANKSKKEDDDDEEDVADVVDDWDKPEEEENWDPDFDEFDLPKSSVKKAGKKESETEDSDFRIDEDLKEFDMFNDSGFDDNADDDF